MRFEGPGTFAGAQPCAATCTRAASPSSTRRQRRAAAPEQAHRLRRLLRADPERRERQEPRPAAAAWRSPSDGATLYVAALGSSKVGVFDTAALENDTFVPSAANQIPVTGGGPTGLVLDEDAAAASTCSPASTTRSRSSTPRRAARSRTSPMLQPRAGERRRTAGRSSTTRALTSSHGDSSCASCHIFGDFDSLAWDLGNPDGAVLDNPGPVRQPSLDRSRAAGRRLPPDEGPDDDAEPARHGQPRPDALARRPHRRQRRAERAAGQRHVRRGARRSRSSTSRSPGLLGRNAPLADGGDAGVHRLHPAGHVSAEPDPRLDNSLTPDQQAGRDFFFERRRRSPTRSSNCNGCHVLDPQRQRRFGVAARLLRHRRPLVASRTRRRSSRSRTCATCTRRSACSACRPSPFVNAGDNGVQGRPGARLRLPARRQHRHGLPLPSSTVFAQRRRPTRSPIRAASRSPARPTSGHGAADGAGRHPAPPADRGVHARVRLEPGADRRPAGDADRQDGRRVQARIELLEARAAAGECDLVVHGQGRGARSATSTTRRRRASSPIARASAPVTDADAARARPATRALTFTAVPPGNGRRIGMNANLDGVLDGDDEDCRRLAAQ